MDISRALSYITDDDDWLQKLLIGGLISLIPIVGQFWALGYATQVLKNIIEGRESPLPELTQDFGKKLLQGLLVTCISIIFFLPLIVIGGTFGAGTAVVANAVDSDAAGVIVAITSACFGLIAIALSIICGLFIPFAWSAYAQSGQFGDAFKLSKFFDMFKANVGQTLLTLLLWFLVVTIAGSVGSAVCGIGAAFTGFYAQLVTAYLLGSLYNQSLAKTQ